MINGREADHPIDKLFLERWSPRAFDGKALTQEELETVLEAARWAPSASNAQPWHFVYALNGGPSWTKLLGLLNETNQTWAKNAGALIFNVSKRDMPPSKDGKVTESYTHSFDCGTAWGFAALQASKMGLVTHGMAGFDKPRAAKELGVPDGYRVEMVFAVGHPGDKSKLPEPLQEREKPSQRRKLTESISEGSLKIDQNEKR